jgi:hypothetical protein
MLPEMLQPLRASGYNEGAVGCRLQLKASLLREREHDENLQAKMPLTKVALTNQSRATSALRLLVKASRFLFLCFFANPFERPKPLAA